MRILQLGKYHWMHPGGLERYLRQMSERYCRPNYDVDIDYVVFDKKLKSSIVKKENYTLFVLGTIAKLRSAPIPYPSSLLREISSRIYDIIEFHHPNPGMHHLYAKLRKGNQSAKLVIFWHSDISRQKILKRIYKPFQDELIRSADRIIVTSRNYMDSSHDLVNFKYKCDVLPFGLEPPMVQSNISRSKKIISVGRLVYYKGFEYLIKAFAHPSMRDYTLTLIGEGPEYKRLRCLVDRYDLASQVEIVGHVSDEILENYYKCCSLFVLPSVDRAEAFGWVLLEAMAHGKPIVTTSLGTGTDFIVKDGYNGRVVRPCSSDELRSAIREIVEDAERMEKMGKASLERLGSTFTISNHFNKKHEIYRSLLNL